MRNIILSIRHGFSQPNGIVDRSMRRRVGAAAIIAVALLIAAGFQASMPASATPPVGASGQIVAQSTIAERIKMYAQGPTSMRILRLTIEPGGTNGWHSHPGPVFVSVESGTVTMYHAGRRCYGHQYTSGEAFAEPVGTVHTARNETTVPLVLYVVAFIPNGQPTGVSEPSPGNCSF